MHSSEPTPDWLRHTSGTKKPCFKGPGDSNSNLVAVGWIEQLRRSKMQMVWKEVVFSIVKGRRPGEGTTIWVQRDNNGMQKLETLQKIPIQWLRSAGPVDDFMGETRFSLAAHNLDESEFIFRCKDPDSTKKWITVLRAAKQCISDQRQRSPVRVEKAPAPEKDLLNFDEPASLSQQRLSSSEFAFLQQQQQQQQQRHFQQPSQPHHQWMNSNTPQQQQWPGQQPQHHAQHYFSQTQPQQPHTILPPMHHQPIHSLPQHNNWHASHLPQQHRAVPVSNSGYQSAPLSGPLPQQRFQPPPTALMPNQGYQSAPSSGGNPHLRFHHPSPPNSTGSSSLPAKTAPPPVPQPPASPSKYGAAAHPPADSGRESVIKRQVVTQWALQPPQLQELRPVDVLVTTIHTIFRVVPRHDYFDKWTGVSRSDLCTHHVLDQEKVQKVVRKLRFFLHTDKLPKDLSSDQMFFCKLLWDIVNDAWEEHKKAN